MKLYSIVDGPPSVVCRQALKALNIKYELIEVDYVNGGHMTDEFEKMNPQKEIPVLVDGDLTIGESNAILQYLCDMYDTAGKFYPKDPKARAIVNHRLCFNLAMYYKNIVEYAVAPIYFDYQRTPMGLKKTKMALDVFNKYLQQGNSEYAAGNTLTIADFALIASTMSLEAIDFKLNDWPYVEKWYNNYKKKHPELWAVVAECLEMVKYFVKNPMDLSHLKHPLHPIRGKKV